MDVVECFFFFSFKDTSNQITFEGHQDHIKEEISFLRIFERE